MTGSVLWNGLTFLSWSRKFIICLALTYTIKYTIFSEIKCVEYNVKMTDYGLTFHIHFCPTTFFLLIVHFSAQLYCNPMSDMFEYIFVNIGEKKSQKASFGIKNKMWVLLQEPRISEIMAYQVLSFLDASSKLCGK